MTRGKVAASLKFIDDQDLNSDEFERLISELESLKEIAIQNEEKLEVENTNIIPGTGLRQYA